MVTASASAWVSVPSATALSSLVFSAAALTALVAFSKVASPQFLLWLLFPVALVAAQRRGSVVGALFGIAAVATAIWFPWLYWRLSEKRDPLVESLVVLRGLALVGLFGLLTSKIRAEPMTQRLQRSSARSADAEKPNLR